jgi:hypothetical protein
MKSVLKQLFESKKFTVALATVIVWLVSLLGFNVSPETVMQVLSPLYAYILAQGVADMNPNNKKPTTTTMTTTTASATMAPTTTTMTTTTLPATSPGTPSPELDTKEEASS